MTEEATFDQFEAPITDGESEVIGLYMERIVRFLDDMAAESDHDMMVTAYLIIADQMNDQIIASMN